VAAWLRSACVVAIIAHSDPDLATRSEEIYKLPSLRQAISSLSLLSLILLITGTFDLLLLGGGVIKERKQILLEGCNGPAFPIYYYY
jgi:hypothetical protein